MSDMPELAEARATAQVLRATARVLRGEQAALTFRLRRAADVMDGLAALTLRCLQRIEQLEQMSRMLGGDE